MRSKKIKVKWAKNVASTKKLRDHVKIKKTTNEDKKIQEGLLIGKNFLTLPKSLGGVLISSRLEGGLFLSFSKIIKEG